MNNKPYLLALNRINHIGPRTVQALLAEGISLKTLFELPEKELLSLGLPARAAKALHDFDMNEIEADLIWEKTEGHHLLTWEDDVYPYLLKEIHDPPLVIYAKGNLSCFRQPALAMVGTRKPSVMGAEMARYFAKELASHSVTIVSGLAQGIDAEVHKGCLLANGCTIAVMGTGIDTIYPRSHRVLADKIQEKGLIITEFPLKSPPIAGHFPRRNRIISGLSLATLVVEAAIKSGTLITARLALEQNREVLAMPGSLANPQAKGCHHLLQQGAKLVTSVQDVLEELKVSYLPGNSGETAPFLATHQENLVKCVGFEITTIDQMVERSGFSIEKVMCDLAELELAGVIKAVCGGYVRCLAFEKETN